MTATSGFRTSTASHSALEQARQLKMPSREKMLARDRSVYEFWDRNQELLEQAWDEWNASETKDLPKLDASLINPQLRAAVEAAWKNPTPENERAIQDLWKEVAPGVYATQFLDLEQASKLRQWFDATAQAGIPIRPPHGIVLNRKGAMIDPRSVGYLAAPDFQSFYRMVVEEYVRPLGRLFFPKHIRETDDDQSFAFSIQYQADPDGDRSMRHHTDASTVTFNINLDATKTWTGSPLIFFAEEGNQQFVWEPGMVVMHLGKSMHAALPIQSGTRSNLVIWTLPSSGGIRTYGSSSLLEQDGEYPPEYQLSAKERWAKVQVGDGKELDWNSRWSPF